MKRAAVAESKIDPGDAGKIAIEELDELNAWLVKRWNATPRDTVLLLKLLRHLPGGEKLTQWTEAAPYLLAVIVATHHAAVWAYRFDDSGRVFAGDVADGEIE